MNIKAIKTQKVRPGDELYKILDESLPSLEENTIVVITSKIISICQGNFVKKEPGVEKKDLIINEADLYNIDENLTKFGLVIPTIKKSILIANAGIDESNTENSYLLWPKNIDTTVEEIWNHLRIKYDKKNIGVIISDSYVRPMRWGTLGVGITWCGIEPLKDYRDTPDVFGRPLEMTQGNILDGVAAATVMVMGEGDEQTPIATVTDIPFVTFTDKAPTQEERKKMLIAIEDDIYGKLLNSVKWEKGGGEA
jgi:putative folate metabolism gamma-glutamate ligase